MQSKETKILQAKQVFLQHAKNINRYSAKNLPPALNKLFNEVGRLFDFREILALSRPTKKNIQDNNGVLCRLNKTNIVFSCFIEKEMTYKHGHDGQWEYRLRMLVQEGDNIVEEKTVVLLKKYLFRKKVVTKKAA